MKYSFCVNKPFNLHVLYLENFSRIYLNLGCPITELIIEDYLSENGVTDIIKVMKAKEKIRKRVFDCVVDVRKNIISYLNIVLDNVAFELIFLTF